MNDMPAGSPLMPAMLMAAAMMVVMMLPSVAPAMARCHRGERGGARTALAFAGYASVWGSIGVAMCALRTLALGTPDGALRAPWAGALLLGAGGLQCSRFKATRLTRCRVAFADARATPPGLALAWRDGLTLGRDCATSCLPATAVLLAAGAMDARAMLVVTLAITAERVAPGGVRVARVTGAAAVAAGALLVVSALAGAAVR